MDYEKKYNEALERARALWREAIEKEYVNDYLKDYETIFPELRESEDERVIRTLYYLVRDHDWLNGATKGEALTWLEKQKESLHISETCKENADSFTSEQKPAWSEEDEKMLSDLRNTLGCLMNAGAISFKTKKKFSNWLKSLRPSWKPSDQDELMKLKYAGTSTKLD